MADNNLQNENTPQRVVIINQAPSSAVGICALIFAIISIFFFAIVFVPLAILLSIIAILRKQFTWGICAFIIACVSAILSPTVWAALLGIAASR
ncbi:MAG: hypothetical protein LBT15_02320 [Synergistaceae bacterium]|nr:hypothetical protein [Synergistaceae bacterium]